MIDIIKWVFNDPWHYAWVISIAAFGMGWLTGGLAKTQPYELKILRLKGELESVLHTIELKNNPH